MYVLKKVAEPETHAPERGEMICTDIFTVRPAAVLSPVTFTYFQSVVIGVF